MPSVVRIRVACVATAATLVMGLGCGPRGGEAQSTAEPTGQVQGAPDANEARRDEADRDTPVASPTTGEAPAPANDEGTAPASDEAPAPKVARATGVGRGVDVIVLSDHELLGSERRKAERLVGDLNKAGLQATRVESVEGARRAELDAWLATLDATARAELPTVEALGDAAAVVVTRIAPPDGRVAKGTSAWLVLQRGETPEIVWMVVDGTGLAIHEDTAKMLAPLMTDIEGAKG